MHKIKQMIKYIATLLLTVLFVACNNGKGQQPSEENEDPKAKEILQGIWLDDETETPLMRIIGDTIYYSDAQSAPVYFKILKDTLYSMIQRSDDRTILLSQLQTMDLDADLLGALTEIISA